MVTISWGVPVVALLHALVTCATAVHCPPCGNTSVPYPLSTDGSCGDPRYRVMCSPSKQLQFLAVSGNYPILAVNPESRRLVIEPAQIRLSTCQSLDLSQGGVVLDNSSPFNVSSDNTIFLLNCSESLLNAPLNCTAESPCHRFVAAKEPPCEGLRCCSFRAGGSSTSHRVPVDPRYCTAYTSVLSYGGPDPAAWEYGVRLEWASPPERLCLTQSDCGPNSGCVPNPNGSMSCLCVAGYHWDPLSGKCGLENPGGQLRKILELTGFIAGVAAVALIAAAGVHMRRKRKAAKEARARLTRERQKILSDYAGGRSAKLFTAKELRSATNNFAKDKLLGSGGFGEVYKGILKEEEPHQNQGKNREVAVKCAKIGNIKGVEQVLNEVRVLSQVNHKCLVRLLGCCVETEQPLLVYEFISNGNLAEHLEDHRQGRRFLTWKTRLKIALQTAEGLAYLHSLAVPPIYHRDVKCSNILIDEGLNAHVSDFGLSRLAEPGLTHISTCAQGTLGYLDPEYYRNYQLTDKSDVYSFGVVLLELITSQKAIDVSRPEDDVNLATLVFNREEEGELMAVVDPHLLPLHEDEHRDELLDSFRTSLSLALRCVHESRSFRPPMTEVAEHLSSIISALDALNPSPLESRLGALHPDPLESSLDALNPPSSPLES